MASRSPKPKPASVGRKSKLTPEVESQIAQAIMDGLSIKDACLLAGIGQSTYYQNLRKNSEFAQLIARTEAEFKRTRLQRIKAAGVRVVKGRNGEPVVEGDYRADIWLMEKRFPDEYGPKLIIKLTPEDAAILKKNGLTAADAWALLMNELATTEPKRVNE